MKLTQQCIAFLCFLALLHVVFLLAVSQSLDATERQLRETRYRVVRASKAMEVLRGVQSWLVFFTLASTLSKKPFFQKELKKISAELPDDFTALCQSTKDHPEDHWYAVQATEHYEFIKHEMEETAAIMANKPDLATVAMMRDRVVFTGFGHLTDAAAALKKLTSGQAEDKNLPRLEHDRQFKSRLILTGSVILTLIGCCILVITFATRVTKRLVIIMENFRRFEEGKEIELKQRGSDEIDQVDSSFRSMAERVREATEREKAIVDNLPNGLIVCAEDGTIESLNPCAVQMLGSEETASKISDLLAAIESVDVPDPKGVIPPSGTYLFKTRNVDMPVEVTVSSYDLKNRRKYLFAVVDVTVKREMELMKQEFVSIVSHDLRTPLTSIKIGLGLLKGKGEVSAASVRSIEMIERESDRLLRLTTDLLDLAKAESGKLVLNRAITSTAALAEQAIAAVLSLAERKSVCIVDNSQDILIDADPDKVCQVLVNFLSNAIKYSPQGSTVTLAVACGSDDVRFSVIDHGQGIPPEALPHVFDRFRQVSVSDAKTGSGLGLAICRLLAECHGGSVGAHSVPGEGSTFWLSLPPLPNQRQAEPDSEG